jgi:outer membrane protease
MFVTRFSLCTAVTIALAMTTAAARAADRYADPQWPAVEGSDAQWPNVRTEDLPSSRPNPRPAFIDRDQVPANPIATKPAMHAPTIAAEIFKDNAKESVKQSASETIKPEVTGSTAQWPKLREDPKPSPFAFEAGARYWYSSGNYRFAFSNGIPGYGTPTSTLDWKNMDGHSGEVFARLDHKPSGFFIKGMGGGGAITSGYIDDKDFFSAQAKFSDTRSDVQNGNLTFAMVDIGWAYSPTGGVKLGVFAGYHYWNEKATAYGLLCKQQQPALGCPQVGDVTIPYDVAVLQYEPTWHAVRIGIEGKFAIDDRWSVSGEIAAIPYAVVQNKDSHLLRQSSSDLGPAPNIITDSRYAYGVETELFVNYAVTRNIEIGAGVRYWGLFSRDGNTHFGPDFADNRSLDNFDQQRYGVLAHIKGKF